MKAASLKRRDGGETREALILLAPLLLLLLIFIAVPALSNFYYSLTRWKGFGEPEWIGLDNFKRLMSDPVFHQALKNTGTLIVYIPFGVFLPLILAAILREGLPGGRLFRSIFFIPNVLGPVIIALVFRIILNDVGPLNTALRAVGLGELALRWLTDPNVAIHSVGLISAVWLPTGFGVIYFMAAMSAIDDNLYDAARIDGAGWWRRFLNVTIPSIRFAIEFRFVIGFVNVFARLFGFVFALTAGGPGYATVTLEFGIYRAGFGEPQRGYAAAWAIVLLLFCSVIAFAQIAILRRREQ